MSVKCVDTIRGLRHEKCRRATSSFGASLIQLIFVREMFLEAIVWGQVRELRRTAVFEILPNGRIHVRFN